MTYGFESLLELADQGWQILYFTAKEEEEEVSEKMVEEYDLEHGKIQAL